ncbi:MAG: hypothetical protein AAF646_17225 [Pseudomonadota bacterium]
MTFLRIPLALSAVLVAAPVLAAVEDTDGDGMYSFEEVLATYPALTEAAFTEIDADGDGMLSVDEVAAAEAAGLLPAEG